MGNGAWLVMTTRDAKRITWVPTVNEFLGVFSYARLAHWASLAYQEPARRRRSPPRLLRLEIIAELRQNIYPDGAPSVLDHHHRPCHDDHPCRRCGHDRRHPCHDDGRRYCRSTGLSEAATLPLRSRNSQRSRWLRPLVSRPRGSGGNGAGQAKAVMAMRSLCMKSGQRGRWLRWTMELDRS